MKNTFIKEMFLEGMTAQEISKKTGVKLSTVYANLRVFFGTGSHKYYSKDGEIMGKRSINYFKIGDDFVDGMSVNELSKKYNFHPRYLRMILMEQFGTASSSKIRNLKDKAKFFMITGEKTEDVILKNILECLKRKAK